MMLRGAFIVVGGEEEWPVNPRQLIAHASVASKTMQDIKKWILSLTQPYKTVL